MVRPWGAGSTPGSETISQLERRLLATLGIELAAVGSDVGALLAAARQRERTG
jgi:hypothetical protein